MKIIGIYKIESKLKPERIYIGSSVNIMNRWSCHLSNLKLNKHGSIKLQNHTNKYGIDDLLFSIIIECRKEDLIITEQIYLDIYKPYFNIRLLAESNLGIKRSLEYKENMSKIKKGHIVSKETRKKLREAWKNRIISDETRQKISKANKGEKNSFYGKHHSEENKLKMRGRLPYNKGMKMSEEQKEKIGKANKGNKMSEINKQRLSLRNIGNKYNLGKKASDETRNKMRHPHKKRA